MLKNLSKNGQRGFTLVELLVAIAIIAILAVIGLTVFTGLQRSARDAQRRSDVEAIAKALEANYNTATGEYTTLSNTMFAGGRLPVDPLTSTNNCGGVLCQYCISEAVGGNPNPIDQLNGVGQACDTMTPNNGTTLTLVTTSQPSSSATGFLVCANLEGGAGNVTAAHYCQGSQR